MSMGHLTAEGLHGGHRDAVHAEGLRLAREYRLVYDEVGLLRLAAEVAGRSGDRPTEEAREAEAAAILRRIGVPAA